MKCFVAVLFGLVAVANAGAPLSYSYANPAGTTFFGFNAGPAAPLAPLTPVAAPVAAVAQYAAPHPVAVAPALAQYAPAQVAYNQYYPQVAAPAIAVQQKVGYAHTPVLTRVPGVANVPVTKLAYSQGVAQKLVDVAQPAVTTRKFKVRRPALRKEFYDIEHRIIVRPAGSATLELSQPLSKEQKGPAVLTPTNYQQVAPVVRYGTSRRIIDQGQGVAADAALRVNLARGIGPAGPAPPQGPPQGPPPQLRSAGPAPRPLQLRPQGPPQAPPQPPPAPQFRQEQPQFAPQQQQFQQQQQQPQQGPQFRNDAEIIEADQQQQFEQQQQQQQQPQQFQQQQPQQFQQQQPQQFQPQPQGPPPAPIPQGPPQPPQQQGPLNPQLRSLNISPNMPAELQARLLELLQAKGGTVTELLGQDGRSDSASVLEVADQLQDINLQGGEKITTRRIVVTRPIETVQEVDIQEPATKVHRVAVDVPFIQKHAIQGVAQVPVDVPAVKHLATPVVKTTFAQPAYAQHAYAAPGYAY